MSFTKESAGVHETEDLAMILVVGVCDVAAHGVSDKDFPDMSLGAATDGEMSAQMISSGWQIKLGAAGADYEYRADKYQLRLHNFKGANYVIA